MLAEDLKQSGESDFQISCQQCLEPIAATDDYYSFGEMHFSNTRSFAKLNMFSNLIFSGSITETTVFDDLLKLREDMKKISEKNTEIFVKSCSHVSHTKCLDERIAQGEIQDK